MENIMVSINNVYKKYRLGMIGGGSLNADIQSFIARLQKKEDPNAKIGDKAYGKNESFLALNGVSFDIKKGERVGIIGHNGAGKSTLLKLLSRVTAPTSGTISYNGRIASMLEVGTGFHPELSGRENIYLNGAILGMSRAETSKKIDDIIEFSECGKFIDTPVKRYSSGMYVKLAFSVAAHLDSEIMIMDEVLAVGDMAFQNKCLQKMSTLAKEENRTILYVSHNMNTIKQLCNRVIVLDHGKVVFDGDTDSGIEKYLSINSSEAVTKYNYTNVEREPYYRNNKWAKFIELELLDKEQCAYKQGEKIRTKINIIGIQDMYNLGIRLEIKTSLNNSVATIVTNQNDLFEVKKGETSCINCCFDISELVDGRYRAVMLLYLCDDSGKIINDVDCLKPAFTFEVVGDEIAEWKPAYWGNIRLPDLEIIKNRIYKK